MRARVRGRLHLLRWRVIVTVVVTAEFSEHRLTGAVFVDDVNEVPAHRAIIAGVVWVEAGAGGAILVRHSLKPPLLRLRQWQPIQPSCAESWHRAGASQLHPAGQ